MNKIDLEYQPPDKVELMRRAERISVASVIAGAFLGLFFTPLIWVYATALISRDSNPGQRHVGEIMAAGIVVTLAVFAGRHIERIMPDARGMAVGICVSTTVIVGGCVAMSFLGR